MLLAAASDAINSSTLLGFVLSGGLITAIIGAYRFAVNYRLSERSLSRDRVNAAERERRAERTRRLRVERESILWQNRSGDLEYALRTAGKLVPPMSEELRSLAFSHERDDDPNDDDEREPASRRPSKHGRGASLDALLRREEQDAQNSADTGTD